MMRNLECLVGEVHVWRIELDGAPKANAAVVNSLNAEERARAARLRTDELRRRWATARGAMRCILADYAGCAAEEVGLEVEAKGKPRLARPNCEVSFNLSHSGGLALLAITRVARVGVDVELVRDDVEIEELSRRYFAPEEERAILDYKGAARVEAFFRCWSRKEAFVKALGGGLSVPLKSFRVSVGSGERQQLTLNGTGRETQDSAENWTLLDVSETGAAAAVAVERPGIVLRRMKF